LNDLAIIFAFIAMLGIAGGVELNTLP